MAKKKIAIESVSALADDLAESFRSGNKSHVRTEIRSLPTPLAVGVAVRVLDALSGDDYTRSSFMRFMTDDL